MERTYFFHSFENLENKGQKVRETFQILRFCEDQIEIFYSDHGLLDLRYNKKRPDEKKLICTKSS